MNKKEFITEFSGRLKLECFLCGKSKEEIAGVAGISATTLHSYIRGSSSPSAVSLAGLCEALGVSSDYLLFGGCDGD